MWPLPICDPLFDLLAHVLWDNPFESIVRILPVIVFFMIAYKFFRTPGFMWTGDFRVEILLLLPWALNEVIETSWFYLCYVE